MKTTKHHLMALATLLLLTAGATSNAEAKPLAAYLETQCVLNGALVPCVVVPDTQLAKCEVYKTSIADERKLTEAAVAEARKYRTKMEHCGGELAAHVATFELERAARVGFEVQVGIMQAEERRRWEPTTWLAIGAALGAAVVGGAVFALR